MGYAYKSPDDHVKFNFEGFFNKTLDVFRSIKRKEDKKLLKKLDEYFYNEAYIQQELAKLLEWERIKNQQKMQYK